VIRTECGPAEAGPFRELEAVLGTAGVLRLGRGM